MEAVRPVDEFERQLEERSLAPLRRTGREFFLLLGLILAVIGWGLYAYTSQAREGLLVTGMRDRVQWGLYIAMFVFFIGASMAGTFVSSILRVTNAGWRTPVTRVAEMVTVAALTTAALFIVLDLGRPDRMLNTIIYGRWESPVTWDIYGLTTYLVGSIIYLYAALIPDLAYCRDRIGAQAWAPKRWLFEFGSIGWRGTAKQYRYLHTALSIMMILVIPVAVMMHTVTSWLFAMTLREPWDSAIFGIFFVGGAVFSGVGIIIILMAILRKVYRLEEYITQQHFLYLGYLLAAFAAIMVFFNISEFVTHAYKLQGEISVYLRETFSGSMAPLYWSYIWGGIALPMALIALPWTRNIAGIVLAAILVNIGMIIERYLIVVGGLRQPLNPYDIPSYSPTWVEWSLMGGGVAVFALIVVVLLKLVPSMAVWEMLGEGQQEEAAVSGKEAVRSPITRPQSIGRGEE